MTGARVDGVVFLIIHTHMRQETARQLGSERVEQVRKGGRVFQKHLLIR